MTITDPDLAVRVNQVLNEVRIELERLLAEPKRRAPVLAIKRVIDDDELAIHIAAMCCRWMIR